MFGFSLHKWKLSYRLIIPTITILLLIFLSLYKIIGFSISRNNNITTQERLKSQLDTAWHIVDQSHQKALETLNSNLNVFHYLFYNSWGKLKVSGTKIEMSVVNPQTMTTEKMMVPQWKLGNKSVQNNSDKVDLIKSITGGIATIYQKTDHGFLRISTNIRNKSGKRLTGTFTLNDSPVIKSILSGKSYKSLEYIVDDWYLTAYEPIQISGDIQGILSMAVKVKHTKKIKTTLKSIYFGETGHFFVMDLYGNLIIHESKEGQNVIDENDTQTMIALKEGVLEDDSGGRKQIIAFKYYQDFNWILVSKVETDAFIGDIQKNLVVTIIYVFIITIIILSLTLYFTSKSVSDPINRVITGLQDITEGEGDLTKRLAIQGETEARELTKWFNRFMEKIQSTFRDISTNSSILITSAEKLAQTSNAIKLNSSDVVNSEIDTSTSMTQSSNTIREMSLSLQKTASKMQELQHITNATEKDSSQGIDVIGRTYKAMDKIEVSSRHIDGIVNVITDIANQIDLLSLNAAIEAAHAGEFGTGFAIVAEQVSNLANRSNNAVIEIRKLISEGNLSIIEGKRVIEQTGQVLEHIVHQVQDITGNVKEISTTIAEHDLGIRELAKGSEEINSVSNRNVNLLESLSQSIDHNKDTITEIKEIADQLEHQVTRFKI